MGIRKLDCSTILRRVGVSRGDSRHWPSYHSLPSSVVTALIAEADAIGYRRPANANGSRARYFYEALCRVAK